MTPGLPDPAAPARPKVPLSVCMITRNEEHNLAACLATVADWAGEIVIVDQFSTDRTVDIARRFTPLVFQQEVGVGSEVLFNNRELSYAKASHDWIFWFDADERVTPALADEIGDFIAGPGDAVAAEIHRDTFFLGEQLTRGCFAHENHVRIFRKSRYRRPDRNFDDGLRFDGPVRRLRGVIQHHPYTSLTGQCLGVTELMGHFNETSSWDAFFRVRHGQGEVLDRPALVGRIATGMVDILQQAEREGFSVPELIWHTLYLVHQWGTLFKLWEHARRPGRPDAIPETPIPDVAAPTRRGPPGLAVPGGDQPIRLNLGCGADRRAGYINVDAYAFGADSRMSIFALEYADGTVDEIASSHMLEHLDRFEVPRALREWHRILKEGGLLRLEVPDLAWCAREWLARPEEERWGWQLDTLFGMQTHAGEYHKTGFTPARIERLLTEAGFSQIRITPVHSHGQECLAIEARKREGVPMDANRGQAVTFAESGLRAAERGEHARAVYELTRALELDSTLLPVRAGRGLALLALGKSGEAIADLEQAARASGDAGMWNNLGCCYAQAGRLGEAQQALAEAARRDPGLVAARTNLGDLFRAQGRIAEARTWYQAALRLDSADVGARDGLAALLGLAVEGQGEAAGGQTGGPPPAAPGAPTQRQPVDAASPAAPGRSGEGTPALAEVQCPLCGTAAAEVVHRLPEAALVRCLACGLAFFTPPPPAERLREIYRGAGPSLAAQLAATRGGELPHALLDRIEEHVPRRGRLLDVGCAHGAVLLAARQRGWTVAGFEISAESVGIARGEFGLDVVQGDHLDQAGFPDGAFDVVTMQHVLEHVVDPLRLLRAARRLLRPGGLLWLAVPNFGGFLASTLGARWGWVTYPNHLVYFTPQTLGLALERAGFRVTRLLSQTAGDQVEQARDLLTRMGLAAAGNGSGIDVEQLDRHLRGAEVIAVASVPAVPGPDAAASPPEPAARGAEKHAIRERWVEGPATGWGDLYGHPEVRRVLDFGCGEKGTIPYEQFPRWEFTGLDRFPPRNLQRAFPANARYVQYEGERIPFPDGHFEFVVANFVLEHVRDPRRVLAELTRVLKRYGFLYAAVPNAVSMADAIYRRSVLPEDEGGHEFKYTFKSFLKLAFEMGFRLLGFQEGVEESLAWIAKEKQNTRFDWLACYDYYAREYGINLRADSYYTFMLQQVGVPGFRVYNDFMAQGRQEAQGKRQASNPALSTQHLAPSTPARPPTPDPAQRLAGLVQAGAEHLAAGRPTEAVEAFRAALAIAPDLAEVRGALGSALVNLGRQAEALTELAAAAEALGTSEAWNNLGCAYALAGRAEEARGAFLEAIQRDGANREPQRNLAALFEALGMPREAAAAYDLLLLAAPDNAEALAGKARCAAALQASGAGAPDDLARAIAERAAAGPRLPGLSAHLLVRNEVELIDLYLDNTLPYVDELIVIDGGSTDGTLGRIRARESDKVRLFVWPQDGAQFTAGWREPHRRNACIALTSRQWILKKDVDEFFREADYARIRDLLATPRDTLVCFPRINFWGDVDHVRLSTAEDPHWSPDPQGNLWRADLGLQWNDQPLHCQLAKDGAIYTRTEVCQEVPIYHYHWALGKRVKPNDLRRGDLVADPAALPPEAEDRAVDPATVRWDRAGVRVARFWDRHPETIERHLGRAMATQPERNLQGLAAYFGRPYEAVKQQYWHSAPAVVDE